MTSSALDRRRLGAISILLGNAGIFANGLVAYQHGDTAESRAAGVGRMASSALSSGGGFILGRYGSLPVAKQLKRMEGKLAAYMKEQGVPLEAEVMKNADAETQKGWFAKLEDFAYDHPIECANVYAAVASSGMLVSGILRSKRGEAKAGAANIISYMMGLTGTLASVLIPERTPEQIAAQGDKGTLWGKIQEKPLNYTIWPALVSDTSYSLQSYGEYQTAHAMAPDNPFRKWMFMMSGISAFVLATATVGDVLIGFSSKKTTGHSDEREAAQGQLIEYAAQMLAAQPPEAQVAFAQRAAEYLVRQQGLRMTNIDADSLSARILESIAQHKTRAEKSGDSPSSPAR